MKTREHENERRNSIIVIILILLLGLICIILASGWAIRFAPHWKLNSSMGSNLNPNSDFLTSRPVGFIEPLDPAILTNPAWIDVFLTPGASFETRIPQSTGTSTATLAPVKTNTPVPSAVVSPTRTLVVTVVIPTITRTSAPPPPSTITPIPPSPTNTTIPPLPSADLQIAKTDGVTAYTPGGAPLMYTITVRNIGPTSVVGAVVTDTKPTQVTTWTWGCTSQNNGATGCDGAASNSANFTDTVNLPSGAWIVYTVMANTFASATGDLVNTANVALPVSPVYNDPIPGNNSATDTDVQNLPSADLQITKTDGVPTYTPGGTTPLTYIITVRNIGINAVIGAVVSDTRPTQISSWAWTCSQTGGATGCNGVPLGNADFTDTVNLPVGGRIDYTVTANTFASATGNLMNTANVAVPPLVYTESNPSDNSATDTDTPTYSTNLGITKDDGSPTYTPGGPITYTIVVSNAGPSNAVGASVTDTIPAEISGVTFNCVANGAAANCGMPNFDFTTRILSYTGMNIPIGDSVTITVSGTVNSGKIGNLTNTATVIEGSGQDDPSPGNDSDTDTDTPAFSSDLFISVLTDNSTDYVANDTKTYTLVVSNAGPSDAIGATVSDTLSPPMNVFSIDWICAPAGGASCTASGSGNINHVVSIPAGATLTYTVNVTAAGSPSGPLVNTATVSLATDPSTPDIATDTDNLVVANPPGSIGATPDGSLENITTGSFLTLQLGSSVVVVGSEPSYDLVYYPDPSFQMDMVILQVSDGSNWYTIFYWGNGSPDGNTDINPADCPSETDNCAITAPPSSGISINLDGIVPAGTYDYIRIISLPDSGDGVDVDAIAILP